MHVPNYTIAGETINNIVLCMHVEHNMSITLNLNGPPLLAYCRVQYNFRGTGSYEVCTIVLIVIACYEVFNHYNISGHPPTDSHNNNYTSSCGLVQCKFQT